MQRLHAGDEDAAREVYDRFAAQLTRLARSRLAHPLRAKLDAEDVIQSVFRSFFVRQRQGDWKLDNWSDLERLLAMITLHKCGTQAARYQAQRRSTARELPLSAVGESSHAWGSLRREPSPEELATLTDLLARLMETLQPLDAAILLLRFEGHSIGEISLRVGRAVRTIWRALKRCEAKVQELEADTIRALDPVDREACSA
jgi:RNA polymerase sigma-70 factor (ECF subfamily)